MQKVHEALVVEAEVRGAEAAPPAIYDPRDNEEGVTFELLLYGRTGRYVAIARRFAVAQMLLTQRAKAARVIGKMLRGWIVRSTIAAYKAAVKVQTIYRRWRSVHKRRKQRQVSSGDAAGGAADKPVVGWNMVPAWERVSRILQRGRKGGAQNPWLALLNQSASDKADASMAKATPTGAACGGAASSAAGVPQGETPVPVAGEPLSEEEQRIADAAARIQAKMRGISAQKVRPLSPATRRDEICKSPACRDLTQAAGVAQMVFSLAEASESMIDKLRNPRGAEAVSAVCKAYRAKSVSAIRSPACATTICGDPPRWRVLCAAISHAAMVGGGGSAGVFAAPAQGFQAAADGPRDG